MYALTQCVGGLHLLQDEVIQNSRSELVTKIKLARCIRSGASQED